MRAASMLIDGYNVLHAAGLGRARYAPRELLQARQSLVRMLVGHLTADELAGATLVFDAREPPPFLPSSWNMHGLHVVFAPPEEDGDADAFIEELIARAAAPKSLLMVSSDRRLQRAARRRRAAWIGSESFLDELQARPQAANSTAVRECGAWLDQKFGATATAAEVAEWLRVFGDILPLEAEPPRRSHRLPKAPATRPEGARRQGAAPLPEPLPAPPRPRQKRQSSGKSKPTEVPARSSRADDPPVFSPEWIAKLQQWADDEQRGRFRAE